MESKPFIEGINVFNEEAEPSEPRGPIVCSSSILLNDNERAFLNKGPKFMMRLKLDETEFETKLEKMIAK